MKTRITITTLLLLACLSALPIGRAQTDNRDDVVQAYIDAIRAELSNGKVSLISDIMNLSDTEAEAFWPIYHEYEIELFVIGDRRLELIESFVAAHQSKVLDDSQAEIMADDWFVLSIDRIRLFKKYQRIIAKRLSPLRAIQFVQIENRVNMVIDIMIASELPLFKHSDVITATNTGISSRSPDEAKAADKKDVEYLFVQTAHAITSDGDKMTLHGVGPTTLFFSDRPERIVGHGTTEESVQIWSEGQDSFAKDPPNATISILEGTDGEIEDIVVVLRDPELVGDKLTYTVKVLDGELPTSGGACSLFIDIIGRPLTPLSVAGVARRTSRRVVRRREVLR
jgi:hypothetical protein